jgi:hypothetical protein
MIPPYDGVRVSKNTTTTVDSSEPIETRVTTAAMVETCFLLILHLSRNQ